MSASNAFSLTTTRSGGWGASLWSGSITVGTSDTQFDLAALATAAGFTYPTSNPNLRQPQRCRIVLEFATNTAYAFTFGFGSLPDNAIASSTAVRGGVEGADEVVIAFRPTTGDVRELVFDRWLTHIRAIAGSSATISINIYSN